MSEHSNPDSVYSPHRTRAPISLTVLFTEPQYTEKQPRFPQSHGLNAKFKIHINLDCSNSGGTAQYCGLKLSAEAWVGVKLSGVMCCVIQHLCILPYHLHYTYAFGRHFSAFKIHFYRCVCPLAIGHMTPVLLALRSTSSATGTSVGIFGLRYREFASIAIMRDKKMRSLWKTQKYWRGWEKTMFRKQPKNWDVCESRGAKWDTFWQKLPAVMATIRISSYLAEEKLKARERNKHDMSWEENTSDKNRRRKSHF